MKKQVKDTSRKAAATAASKATRSNPEKKTVEKSAAIAAPAARRVQRNLVTPKRGASAAPAASTAEPRAESAEGKTLADLVGEVRGLRAAVAALAAPATPTTEDPSIEGSADALRRLLSELLEQRLEGLAARIVMARTALDKPATVAQAAEHLDRSLGDLGVTACCAERLEWVDPLIHVVAGEREDGDVPDAVVLETIRPGYRTARGTVVSKASVVVNRRP